MDSTDLLSCVEIVTAQPVEASVIWLHGLGADGHDFEPVVPLLGLPSSPGVRFVFPHAPRRPVTINGGMIMPAWYDIRALSLRREVDEDGVEESAVAVRALLSREKERGVPSGRIVLAGFSQGGAMALHVALGYPERLAGVVALSCYLVTDPAPPAGDPALPIFQAHGTFDPMVPIAAGEQARDALRAAGYRVDWHTYPMGHEVVPDEIKEVGLALNALFQG
jgi:phospholipase/carboxylesterase